MIYPPPCKNRAKHLILRIKNWLRKKKFLWSFVKKIFKIFYILYKTFGIILKPKVFFNFYFAIIANPKYFFKFLFLTKKHKFLVPHTSMGDLYFIVDYIESVCEGNYDEVGIMLFEQNYDAVEFFKTQGFNFDNFYKFPFSFAYVFGEYVRLLNDGLIRNHYSEREWKNKKIKISDHSEKKIFINPTANSLVIKTEKDFWLQLAEKLKKETDYKVVFRSHSPNPEKFKDYSDTKIHDLFLKVFGKNTIVLALRSGFTDMIKTCDLKKILLLQSEKDYYGRLKCVEYSKNKESHCYMHPDFEYFLSEHFGEKDIEKIIASIKKT